MRVLHVINSLRFGGAEKMVVELASECMKRGVHCDILVFKRSRTAFTEQAEAAGMRVLFTCRERYLHPLNLISFIRILRSGYYDVIHTHLTYPQLWVAVASLFCLGKTKLVTTEHSTNNHRRNNKFLKPVDRFIYSRYRNVISISATTRKKLLEWIDPADASKYVVIENGVRLDRFRKALSADRKNFGWGKADTVLIMVGRLAEAKDQETVIRALSRLDRRYKLLLAGDGPTLHSLQWLAEQEQVSGRVVFAGNRTDIPELMKMSDLYIQSSHWEGMPTTVLEAIAAGVATIGSDVPGIRELLPVGALFPHGDEVALAKLIADAEHIDREAQQNLVSRYDIGRITGRVTELYQN